MTRQPVLAVSARRRARAGLAVALVTSAALWAAGVHLAGTADNGEFGIGLICGSGLIVFLLPFLAQGYRARVDDERYLTAWTVSGWRTVDLHRLMRVGRVHAAEVDLLVLVDVDDVRLVVDDRKIDEATKRALVDHPNDAVRVSAAAAHRLGLSEAPLKLRVWWFVRMLVAPFLFIVLWFGMGVIAQLVVG
jgi:hypothetical protein